MTETKNRPHLSASQLEMFARCPEQWRRRYIENDVIPPAIAMLQGTGVHGGAKVNFTQKIESHTDLPTEEIQEAAVAAFETGVKGGYVLSEEEESQGASVVLGKAKDTVALMAAAHGEKQAADYQPVLVEQGVRIELPMLDRDLFGVIDLVDDADRVTDFKTATRRKSQGDADSSIQLGVYAAAFQALTDRHAKEIRLDTLVQLKRGVERDLITTTREQRDFEALSRRIQVVLATIKAGVFPPAMPGSWWCHPKWCGYFNSCPYQNPERHAAAESNGSHD